MRELFTKRLNVQMLGLVCLCVLITRAPVLAASSLSDLAAPSDQRERAIKEAPAAGPSCGDTILDAGEECDDGNTLDGDCCSSTCLFESAGSACADDGEPCTVDQCDGAGTCGHGDPRSSCSLAAKGQLSITKGSDDSKDSFLLKLTKAPATAMLDFGDPTTTDGYYACIFGTDGLLMHAQVAPGGTCDGKPCWVATKKGYKFKDKNGSNDGINQLILKGSTLPKTALTMRGKGSNLPDPLLPLPVPVMAQIVNAQTGQCFETYFLGLNKIRKNSSTKFIAKAADPTGGSFGLQHVQRDPDGTSMALTNSDAPAPPAPAPDPHLVYVESISYGGSGCPQGSVGQSLSADRQTFTLMFDSFFASSGPGLTITDARKTCQINVNLHIPQGWSYSIASMGYRGYVQLPAGLSATQKSLYYFSGQAAQASADAKFTGPIAKDYLLRDTIPMSAVVWSNCKAVVPINIKTEIRIDNPSAKKSGQISVDSIDGKFKGIYTIAFKPC